MFATCSRRVTPGTLRRCKGAVLGIGGELQQGLEMQSCPTYLKDRLACTSYVPHVSYVCECGCVCVCRRDLAAEFDLELPFDT